MNQLSLDLRSSHVNSDTSIPRAELAWPRCSGRVLRHPKLHASAERGEVTSYGGLAVAAGLVRKLELPRLLDERLKMLKLHLPYTESDHVLAQVYNLYVGGTCLEDLANLQGSEAVRRMLGACRLPDPTTAGDFLRRFGKEQIEALFEANLEIGKKAWKWQRGKGRATIDVDGTISEVSGDCREGAD